MDLTETLFSLQDGQYQQFQRKLIPNIDPETILGVRTPELRRIARQMYGKTAFLDELPHRWFEENQIHGFLLEQETDFSTAVFRVEQFLPYVDNWATCDQLRPKAFSRQPEALLPYIKKWLKSDHVYTIRFGIEMLMCHFLDSEFEAVYPQWVSEVRNQDYYVKMMAAWYFATALAKQYSTVLPYITQYKLDPWAHNKTIQKAVESCRITPEQKAYLKEFRIKTR